MRPTLRDRGLSLGTLSPGATNSIVDVAGVRVGHATRIEGEGRLDVGRGPVRTGVTVVMPPGRGPWPAAVHVINGYGKTLGLMQVEELGEIEAPIFLTNTLSVGAVQQAYLEVVREGGAYDPGRSLNVVVAECNDGYLNDLWGLHVGPADVRAALADAAAGRPPDQGGVGAGTGMVAFGHKGGIGTASRLAGEAVVGCLVLANCGRAADLRAASLSRVAASANAVPDPPPGSIIILLATDAALEGGALGRLARRATHGLARTGAVSDPGSGDLAVAFRAGSAPAPPLDALFRAVVESTEEAVWNALFTAEAMTGRDGHVAPALPVDAAIAGARGGEG